MTAALDPTLPGRCVASLLRHASPEGPEGPEHEGIEAKWTMASPVSSDSPNAVLFRFERFQVSAQSSHNLKFFLVLDTTSRA